MGPVLGGLMVDWFGWRAIFLVNLPIGLGGILMTLNWIDETAAADGSLDPAGQGLAMIALCALTAAMIEGGAPRSPHALVPGLAVAAVLALAGFLAGRSAIGSGLAFLPFPLALLAANLWAGRLVARFGPRLPMAAGLAVAAAGFAALLAVGTGTPWPAMLPGLIVLPAGVGTAVPAMTTALLASVPRPQSGIASGVLNTVRQSGGAMGVALFGSLLAQGGVGGMHRAFLLALVLLGGAAVLALNGIGRAS